MYFILDLPFNFTMCSSMLCSLSFDSTSETFEFRWSIIILKVCKSLLSAKCRSWRILQKWFRIIVFWIPSLPIRLSTHQYTAIVGHLLTAITKFISRNAFNLSFWLAQRFDCSTSILAAFRGRSLKKTFLLGKLFHLDWVVFLARGDTLLAWWPLLFWFTSSILLFCSFLSSLTDCHLVLLLKISLSCSQGNSLSTSCLHNFFFSYELSVRIIH